jgi:hypothetical protein
VAAPAVATIRSRRLRRVARPPTASKTPTAPKCTDSTHSPPKTECRSVSVTLVLRESVPVPKSGPRRTSSRCSGCIDQPSASVIPR